MAAKLEWQTVQAAVVTLVELSGSIFFIAECGETGIVLEPTCKSD